MSTNLPSPPTRRCTSSCGTPGWATPGRPPTARLSGDEGNSGRRIVRAIWARDRDTMADDDWQNPTSPNPGPRQQRSVSDVARSRRSPHAGAAVVRNAGRRPRQHRSGTGCRAFAVAVRVGRVAGSARRVDHQALFRVRRSVRSSRGTTSRRWAATSTCAWSIPGICTLGATRPRWSRSPSAR